MVNQITALSQKVATQLTKYHLDTLQTVQKLTLKQVTKRTTSEVRLRSVSNITNELLDKHPDKQSAGWPQGR